MSNRKDQSHYNQLMFYETSLWPCFSKYRFNFKIFQCSVFKLIVSLSKHRLIEIFYYFIIFQISRTWAITITISSSGNARELLPTKATPISNVSAPWWYRGPKRPFCVSCITFNPLFVIFNFLNDFTNSMQIFSTFETPFLIITQFHSLLYFSPIFT